MMNTAAATKGEWTPIRKFTNVLFSIVGVGAIAWTTAAIVHDWGSLDWHELLRSFLLTVWLPTLFYVDALLMTVEVILKRLPLVTADRQRLPKRIALAVFLCLHFREKPAARFDGQYNGVAHLYTYCKTRQFMRDFQADLQQLALEQARQKDARLRQTTYP